MVIKGHLIERKIPIKTFLDTIKDFKEKDINTTKHTFFRLNEKQRKIFKDKIIKEYILYSTPVLAGIQYNRNYAVFYKYDKNERLKVILDIEPLKMEIVTFKVIDIRQMPRI